MDKLTTKEYQKTFVSHFAGDESGDKSPRLTPKVFYSKAEPTAVSAPRLLAWSDELAAELGIEKPASDEEVDVLAGNRITPSMYPYAARYAGHQFGHFAGQLGDGRAITLGEWESPQGELWELQLKGAGPTPYSRRADGRAVLRSSVREYLMSEAMHYLGVPTTRALSLVATGDKVIRDMFYNGNLEYEPGAIVMRVAPTFLRFGNFEVLAARNEVDNLRRLTDWTIERYYPHLTGEDRVLRFFSEVVERTVRMVVEWMRVGFVHGVMNTDNMSILGLTIDYGPYSFIDDYDPMFTPNTTDLPGRRYAFGRQASVAQWNLSCLAGALSPLLPDTKGLQAALDAYGDIFQKHYYPMMAAKLGLGSITAADYPFISRVEKVLAEIKPDMTIFYQLLADLPLETTEPEEIMMHFKESFYRELSAQEAEAFTGLIRAYLNKEQSNSLPREEAVRRMRSANPRFILRNYLLHQAIEELEGGQDTLFNKLQEAMKEPYSHKGDEFFARRPDWAAQKAGCSMLSCSS
ncbi:MAG TPA: YdiU family protein [Chitinophagaceae bacterium]